MKKIVGPDNKVAYGSHDELLDFNFNDYRLKNFFGKTITGLRKKWAFHAFNYAGIFADDYLVAFAAVRLGYLHSVFAYLYHYKDGLIYEYETKGPGMGKLQFPQSPDEYEIKLKKGKTRLSVVKSHNRGQFDIQARFGGRLSIDMKAGYALESHHPLRVLNPSDPYRFTFTEKCSPIEPRSLSVTLDGKHLDFPDATVLYDWSGGYLRRETNWYWGAFSKKLDDQTSVGANFAALVNEAFFSENAFWINNQRTRVDRCVFDLDQADLYRPWRLYSEDGKVELEFLPQAERSEKLNAIIIKSCFRQFFGDYSGRLIGQDGKEVRFEGVHGVGEFHRALW